MNHIMHVRTSLTRLAAAAVLLTSASTATAAAAPLPAPHITNHFKLAASQQPENITVDRTGAAYLTFSFARQIVRVAPGRQPYVLATLPAPAKASTPNVGKAFIGGIARATDGTLYVTYATGTADLTGIWPSIPAAARTASPPCPATACPTASPSTSTASSSTSPTPSTASSIASPRRRQGHRVGQGQGPPAQHLPV